MIVKWGRVRFAHNIEGILRDKLDEVTVESALVVTDFRAPVSPFPSGIAAQSQYVYS